MRGVFRRTQHLTSTLRFVSLKRIEGEEFQPYKALPNNTHHFYLIVRETKRETAKPEILVSIQLDLTPKASMKTADDMAVEIMRRLPGEIETAPDCEQFMLDRVPPGKGEKRIAGNLSKRERSYQSMRDVFWSYHISKIFDHVNKSNL